MAGMINPVSIYAPEEQEKLDALTFQQRMAVELMKKGLSPDMSTQMAGQIAIRRSPLEGLASMASAWAGKSMNEKASKDNIAISQALFKKVKADELGTNPAPSMQQPQMIPQPLSTPNPTVANPDTPSFPTGQQQSQPTGQALSAALTGISAAAPSQTAPVSSPPAQFSPSSSIDKDLAASLRGRLFGDKAAESYYKDRELTPEYKNMQQFGLDPSVVKRGMMQEYAGKGLVALREGDLVRPNADGTATSIYTQPKLENGMQPVRDAQGRVMGAQAIPGYASGIAGIKGQVAGATSSAESANKLIKVDTPNGPVMMTEAQAVGQAGGGSQGASQSTMPQITGRFTNLITPQLLDGFKATESSGNALAINPKTKALGAYQFLPETAAMMHKQGISFNPFDEQDSRRAAAQYMSNLLEKNGGNLDKAIAQYGGFVTKDPSGYIGRVKSYTNNQQTAQPSQVGIPLQNETSSSFGREVGSKSAQSLLDNRDKAKSANDELTNVYEIRDTISKGAYQGFGADFKMDSMKVLQSMGIPIDMAQASNTDYLKSQMGKALLDNAKKLGINPTDADARRIEGIVGTVGKEKDAMNRIADFREEMANRVIDNHNKDVNSAISNGAKFPIELRVEKSPNKYASGLPSKTTFDAPPDPSKFSGKRIKAPDGSVLRSNGSTWIRE